MSEMSAAEAISHFRQLVEENSPTALSEIVYLAIGGPRSVTEAAIAALDVVIEKSPGLRTSLRASAWLSYGGLPWRNQQDFVKQIELIKAHPNSFGLAVTWSFSPNGYVREAGVRAMATMRDDRVFPFLLLRVLDWVSPIANLAESAFSAALVAMTDDVLSGLLETCIVLTRSPAERAKRVVRAYVSELSSRTGVVSKLRMSKSDRVQRFLMQNAVFGADEDSVAIVASAFSNGSPMAVRAASKLVSVSSADAQLAMLPSLAGHPNRWVGMLAVEIADRFDRVDVLESSLFHANWRVRNDARYYLKQRGITDFRERYLRELPSPAAIEGFAEVVTLDSDLEVLVPFLAHEQTRVRVAALRSLGSREYRASLPAILALLGDPRSRVVRLAVAALESMGGSFGMDQALRLMDDLAVSLPVRRARQLALDLVPLWDRIALILVLARRGTLAQEPSRLVIRWTVESGGAYRRGVSSRSPGRPMSVAPSREQLERAFAELALAKHSMDEGTVQDLREEFDFWAERLN